MLQLEIWVSTSVSYDEKLKNDLCSRLSSTTPSCGKTQDPGNEVECEAPCTYSDTDIGGLKMLRVESSISEIQFNSVYSHFYKIFTLYIVR